MNRLSFYYREGGELKEKRLRVPVVPEAVIVWCHEDNGAEVEIAQIVDRRPRVSGRDRRGGDPGFIDRALTAIEGEGQCRRAKFDADYNAERDRLHRERQERQEARRALAGEK